MHPISIPNVQLVHDSFQAPKFYSLTTRTISKTRVHALKHMSIPPPPAGAHFTASRIPGMSMIFTPKTMQIMSARCSSSEYQQHHVSTDYFLNYIPEDLATHAQREHEVIELRTQVRKELLETIGHKSILEQLDFIDDIQRLGVGYHFQDEIEVALNQIYDLENHCRCHGSDHHHDLDLYHTSLKFRLLRQHGFYVRCDLFEQFLDGNGDFEVSLASDIKGMLSLYEASHLRTHGDDILDGAFTFTTTQLKLMTSRLALPQAAKVSHALEQPLHKGVVRLESRHYISSYENDPCHNKILLKFAKLDFNLHQSFYKKQLKDLTRWYGCLDVYARLPCNVREAVVETYYCALGACDQLPQHFLCIIIYFKMILVGTIIDDLYDVCDIVDLELLTKAIQRWDKGCVDQLPDNLKLIYTKLLDTFEEVRQHLTEEGRLYAFPYAMESFKTIWTNHLQTSEWCREKYDPTFEEYMTIAVESCGLKFCTVAGCLGIEEISTQEGFEWAQHYPKAIEAIGILFRLMDDIADHDDPMERTDTHKVTAISCYMKQHKTTDKIQVHAELQKILDNVWKDINYAMLRPTTMPKPVVTCVLNHARSLHVLYRKGDGYTTCNKTPMKENIALLFKDPIPM